MEQEPLTTFLIFAVTIIIVLLLALRRLQRKGKRRRFLIYRRLTAAERQRLAHLLQDDIGQKFAAARVNLSALRLQLRTGALPETAELDAALDLLDDGCRDLRTVSRLMATDDRRVFMTEANTLSDGRKEH